jgi:hypothetical protein
MTIKSVPVIWHAQQEGRGTYNCTTMLNDLFDRYDCNHCGCLNLQSRNIDGAVVVVHGGREIGHIDRLNQDLDRLKWAILIFLGDEEASFPVEEVEHDNYIAWVQEPLFSRPGHAKAKRFLLDGYSHECPRRSTPQNPKDLDWFFAGQVTHERRRACRDALQSIDWGGVIIETKGYCQGISPQEYFWMMYRSRIIPCPSGPFSQDSARIWEALECGSIPILDDFSPTRRDGEFWSKVIPGSPLLRVSDWRELPKIIEKMKLANLDRFQRETLIWWNDYKWKFWRWLEEDLKELGVEAKCG